jgi:transcriptional regulator with XRE-family HTH domain
MSTELAELLRDLRRSRGESLREAANGLGIDPSHLSRIERGQKQASEPLRERAAKYYAVDDVVLDLAAGDIPDDVVEILRQHPELISRLRSEYGGDNST